MKEIEFNSAARKWDHYRTFYVVDGPFIHFETGEVMLWREPSVDQRGYAGKFGVELLSTREHNLPKLFLDKDREHEVKPTWLNVNGQQSIAVDREQGVAVSCDGYGAHDNSDGTAHTQGRNFKSAPVVWAAPHALPTSKRAIRVSRPAPLPKETRRKLADVRAVITAQLRMENTSQSQYYTSDARVEPPANVETRTVESMVQEINERGIWRQGIADYGFATPRTDERFKYLYL